ncbi:hypothetical protein [Bradyrhizobium japonicum]|uniref:hypothetical protein n=1 Tax=Bradyrhizobium japonicum TaxID=375 RepID=UPI001269D3D3|nr:hypothetical protein [Bradyrhizobium japonicum]
MNRAAYRKLMQGLRAETRAAVQQYGIGRDFVAGGVRFIITAERPPGRMPRYYLRTSRLSERPRRALAVDALAWAAEYRRTAQRYPMGRVINLEAARRCVLEAATYRTNFNALP